MVIIQTDNDYDQDQRTGHQVRAEERYLADHEAWEERKRLTEKLIIRGIQSQLETPPEVFGNFSPEMEFASRAINNWLFADQDHPNREQSRCLFGNQKQPVGEGVAEMVETILSGTCEIRGKRLTWDEAYAISDPEPKIEDYFEERD
jgi:hypothetical protein